MVSTHVANHHEALVSTAIVALASDSTLFACRSPSYKFAMN